MARGGEQIRRRRECEGCTQRFTTYERVETGLPSVVKKGGGRVPYDREKVRTGVVRATWKREVTDREIDDFLDRVEQQFRERSVRDIPSKEIGQEVLRYLLKRDQVAYVRFASVYGDFSDLTEFEDLLHGLDNGE